MADRGTHVLNRKARAVLPPKDLVVHPMDRPIAESCINGAVLGGVGAAVGVGVMDHGVRGFPEELVRLPSQHLGSRRVDERGESLPVQAVDTLTRRAQDQLPVPPQLFEGLLRLLPLRDVSESHDGPNQAVLRMAYRGAHVLDREARTVLPPEDLVVHPVDRPIAESCIDGAALGRIRATVGVGVMDHRVLGLSEELVRLPSQHLCGRRVDERREPLPIQAVDTLSRGREDQLQVPLNSLEGLLRSTQLGQVAQRSAPPPNATIFWLSSTTTTAPLANSRKVEVRAEPLGACGPTESLFVTMVLSLAEPLSETGLPGTGCVPAQAGWGERRPRVISLYDFAAICQAPRDISRRPASYHPCRPTRAAPLRCPATRYGPEWTVCAPLAQPMSIPTSTITHTGGDP